MNEHLQENQEITLGQQVAIVLNKANSAPVIPGISFEMVIPELLENLNIKKNTLLSGLPARLEDVTKEQMEAVKEAKKEIKKLRLDVDKRAKERTKDLNSFKKIIKSMTKELHKPIDEIENDYDKVILAYDTFMLKAENERKAQDEVRKTNIKNRIEILKRISYSSNSTVAELEETITNLTNFKAEPFDYQEFTEGFDFQYSEIMQSLCITLDERKKFENQQLMLQQEKEKMIEAARLKDLDEKRINGIKERIQAINMYPMQLMGKTATDMQKLIETFKESYVNDPYFHYHEFLNDANVAINTSTLAISNLHQNQLAMENQQAELAKERAKIEEEKAKLIIPITVAPVDKLNDPQIHCNRFDSIPVTYPIKIPPVPPVSISVDKAIPEGTVAVIGVDKSVGEDETVETTVHAVHDGEKLKLVNIETQFIPGKKTIFSGDDVIEIEEKQSIGGKERLPEQIPLIPEAELVPANETITITKNHYWSLKIDSAVLSMVDSNVVDSYISDSKYEEIKNNLYKEIFA